jgi:hypothetical protein
MIEEDKDPSQWPEPAIIREAPKSNWQVW